MRTIDERFFPEKALTMALHNDLGAQGEYEARLYLMREGYTLHDMNWRDGHLEIDLVAEWWGEVVFVEVKTRRDEGFASAEEAVTLRKKANVIEAAHRYLASHGWTERPYRFDIITVVGSGRPFRITHLRDAYTEREVRRRRSRQNRGGRPD